MRQIIYVKYNRTRSEKFQLKTAIVRENGALSVEKTALTEAGAGHMGSFWEKYQMIREQNPRIRFLEPEFKDGGKTVCDIPAHADGVRGIQPDVRVVSVLAGKGLNAGRGGDDLFRGLQRVLHKILQPEAV